VPSLSDLFSCFGDRAKAKLLILSPSSFPLDNDMGELRSLNIEHVSLAGLMRQEISRRTPVGFAADRAIRLEQSLADDIAFALMRRWFWTRKPDAGFILSGFPATLLQAKVFDEWLEARDEALNGVVVSGGFDDSSLVEYYRTLGLFIATERLAA
jgi:adenylate kinase